MARRAGFYNGDMMDDQQFRRICDTTFEDLKKALFVAEESADFETEESGGTILVIFEEPAAKFVITPNNPVRQIWISALTSSFKLDWVVEKNEFVLNKTGETLKPLVARLINEQLQRQSVVL